MIENQKRPTAAPGRARRPEFPAYDAPDAAEPWSEDWREATLLRLEAWVEERERLIDELERRIDEGPANVVLHPSAFACVEPADPPSRRESAGNVIAKA